MNKKLGLMLGMVLLIVVVSAAVAEKEYVLIEIYYENGNFHLINETLEKGNYPVIEHETGLNYKFNLVSDKGEVLFTSSFDPVFVFTDGLDNEKNNGDFDGGVIEMNESNFFIIVPNIKKSDKIEIFEEDKKVFEAKIDFEAPKSCRLR